MNSKKHKLPRRILAMLLAICMFVTMFPSAMFAVPGGRHGSRDTDAYFYVLKPDYSGTLQGGMAGNYYYVGKGKVADSVSAEFDATGEAVRKMVTTYPTASVDAFRNLSVPNASDTYNYVGEGFSNVTWYRTVYAWGANSNQSGPIISGGRQCWHVDGFVNPAQGAYQVRFYVNGEGVAVYNNLTGTPITNDNVQEATNAVEVEDGQHVEWFFDEECTEEASADAIIEKTKTLDGKVLNIYGKIVDTKGSLNIEIYKDGTKVKNISEDTLGQYITNLTTDPDGQTTDVELNYQNDKVVVGYQYDTYNAADLQFSVSEGYVLQAVEGTFIVGQNGCNGINQNKKSGTYTVDNVDGDSTLKLYLSTAYQVKYYLDGVEATDSKLIDNNIYIAYEQENISESNFPKNSESLTDEQRNVGYSAGWSNKELKNAVTTEPVPENYSGWFTTKDGTTEHMATDENPYTDNGIKNAAENNDDGTPTVIECYARNVIQDGPTYDELKKLINVNIKCTTIDNHKLEDQALKANTEGQEDSYSVKVEKQQDGTYIATVTVESDLYINDLNKQYPKNHTLNGSTQDDTVVLKYNTTGDNQGWIIAYSKDESKDGTVNFEVFCEYDLTGITKTLVTDGDEKKAADTAGVDVSGDKYLFPENTNDKITIPYDGSVTLLYKITVSGKACAGFVVDDPGATLVDSEVTQKDAITAATQGENEGKIVGTIPEGANSVTFYVEKTFGKNGSDLESIDGQEGQYLVNKVTLESKDGSTVDPGNDPDDPDDPKNEDTVIIPGEIEDQTFTLTYNANGGTFTDGENEATVSDLSASENLALWNEKAGTLPEDMPEDGTPTRDGAIFMGWALADPGTDNAAIYEASDAYPELITSIPTFSANTTVYAVWGADEYGDNGEGGDGIPDAQQIIITPAKITIYKGGEGYESVVTSEEGDVTGSETNNGFPEPGYYFTLPAALNDLLRESTETDDTPVNLANDLKFVSGTSEWTLSLYNPDSTSMAYDRYVYTMSPSGENTDPVRLVIDDNGTLVTSDNFAGFALSNLYETYSMHLYTGNVVTDSVKAKIDTNNDETWEDVADSIVKGIALGTNELVVRGTINNNPISTIQSDVSAPVGSITAADSDNVTYYVNGSAIPVNNQDAVRLLADSIVDENGTTQQILEEAIVNAASNDQDVTIESDYVFDFSYLDLVDTSNGNAYATTGGDEVTIYWPYPEGMDRNDTFYIAHFDGLDREFDGDVASEIATNDDVNLNIYHEGDATYKLETTEYGIKFTTSTFSPFALVYDASQADNGGNNGGGGWTPDGGDDGPDGLNTEDHFSYIVGYAEDYRTGEPTDNEDLWPVKPNNQITRAEVATIFYRLLEDEVRDEYDTTVNDFSDVSADSWYNQTVSTLARMGIVKGYEDGSFRPNAPITRAEFGAIATRFFAETGATYEPGTFTDVTGDEWYANAIQDAVNLGLIGGYPDGTVRPNNNITRAEACAIVNRTLGRVPDADHLLPEDVMKVWPDNNPTDWFYADMQEATNGHEYAWIEEDGHEIEEWTNLLDKDWTDR